MDSEEGENSNAIFSYGVKLENPSFWGIHVCETFIWLG